MEWIDPIFDRTQEDIDNKTPKAFLNASDLNRIENDIAFNSVYYHTTVVPKVWQYGERVTVEEMERILGYLNDLSERCVDAPDLPTNPILTYEQVNEIEYFIRFVYEYYRHRIEIISQPVAGYYCAGEPLLLIAN